MSLCIYLSILHISFIGGNSGVYMTSLPLEQIDLGVERVDLSGLHTQQFFEFHDLLLFSALSIFIFLVQTGFFLFVDACDQILILLFLVVEVFEQACDGAYHICFGPPESFNVFIFADNLLGHFLLLGLDLPFQFGYVLEITLLEQGGD